MNPCPKHLGIFYFAWLPAFARHALVFDLSARSVARCAPHQLAVTVPRFSQTRPLLQVNSATQSYWNVVPTVDDQTELRVRLSPKPAANQME